MAAAIALRSLPFHRVQRLARRLNRHHTKATAAEVEAMLDAIDLAASWIPVRVACLERSLAALALCGLHRRSVRWCMGVRTPPFAAHAWIEVAGTPVGELVAVSSYLPILTIETP